MASNDYFELTSRNGGYIDGPTQEKIRDARVLIAGCGIGSQVAMALVRMGVTRFSLIDGDHVSLSNLNRQSFYHDQIGHSKSQALAENLRRINPQIEVNVCEKHFDQTQTHLLNGIDIVIDTIDFLDLSAILLLHEAAEKLKIPLISGMSVGWGSCGIYFPNTGHEIRQFRKIFAIENESEESKSYVLKFAQLFERIKDAIDPKVVSVMHETFVKIANNQPCPAPQVVGGSYNLASLVSTLLFQHMNGDKIPEGPYLIISDLNKIMKHSLFNLG